MDSSMKICEMSRPELIVEILRDLNAYQAKIIEVDDKLSEEQFGELFDAWFDLHAKYDDALFYAALAEREMAAKPRHRPLVPRRGRC